MIEVNGNLITTDLDEIINTLKVQLELRGITRFYKGFYSSNDYMICCPFHKDGQERKPSMGIRKSDGLCHCFACEWTGHLTELISKCFGYEDYGVYGGKWLVQNFLSISVEKRELPKFDFSRKKITEPKKYVTETELDSYRYTHPYMYKRKLTDDIIELFDIGYDKQTNCITFPVRDINGNCVFVARRSVVKKFFNYPEGVDKPLYGLYELSQLAEVHDKHWEREIIVCESMIDALTCWVYGKPALAMNGLGNDLQFKQLNELPCRELVIATDNDDAGKKARIRIAQRVHNKILKQYLIPEGKKDINDLSETEFNNMKKVFI